MDVYVARQPIFDRKMKVYGYELLYRKSMNNFYEGTDGNKATAELINNAFITMKLKDLASGTRAFINFSEELLLKEIPQLLPKEQVVVEILEHVEPTKEVIQACNKLKKNGYIIALDDFVFQPAYEQLIELADIIKIEFPLLHIDKQKAFIRQHRHNTLFLAEKVETREEYELAHKIGYEYFQGYFFSKPVVIKGQEKLKFNNNLLQISNEITDDLFDYQKVAMIIERDVGLSYKLLKLANSVFYGSQSEIYSIRQAIARLGTKELRKWVYLLLLQDIQTEEINELINRSMIRAKFMELITRAMKSQKRHLEFFLLGLFSSLDVILHKPMCEVLEELSLADDVKAALQGESNEFRMILDHAINFENGDWTGIETWNHGLTPAEIMSEYVKAIEWADELKKP